MSHYKHLTLSEREKLMYFLAKGYSVRRIAKELGRSTSTISRELKRNSSKGEYLPVKAEARYHKRRKKCRREKLLTNISEMQSDAQQFRFDEIKSWLSAHRDGIQCYDDQAVRLLVQKITVVSKDMISVKFYGRRGKIVVIL